MEVKKIVICGGHLAPALAIIQLLGKKKDYKIFYIGRKYAAEGDKAVSLEYLTISKLNIPFYSLNSSRFQRHLTWYTLPSLAKFPLAAIQALYFLLRIKPKIVLSFGGYVALPVCLWARLLKIPVITHEQTHILGLTNRIICKFAKVLCLSWLDTKAVPKGVKTIFTGIPIRADIFSPAKTETVDFGNKKLPLLYVTGGSLGSYSINRLISDTLSYLTSRFRIIHQCGGSNNEADFKLLSQLRGSLPAKYSKNYWPITHVNPSYIGSILHNASLVICRAGANTVIEIAVVGTPTIFIPLPWSAEGEQEYNAKMLESVGLAEILRQEQATSEKLIKTIELMMENLVCYRKKASFARRLIKTEATKILVELIESYL